MNKVNKNLWKKMLGALGVGVLALNITAAHALSASVGNGCEDEDNYYIHPSFALCSTHVYNIGGTTNPEDEDTRDLMRDVVALKSTIITQQMYKQYEYLDATVRRLKTQLQKAVLASKLEAAGASNDNDDSSSSSRSTNRNIILAGANDCGSYWGTEDTLTCLQKNYNLIDQAFRSGNYSEARKQIQADWNAGKGYLSIGGDDVSACATVGAGKSGVDACMKIYRPKLAKAMEDHKNSKQSNNGFVIMQPGNSN